MLRKGSKALFSVLRWSSSIVQSPTQVLLPKLPDYDTSPSVDTTSWERLPARSNLVTSPATFSLPRSRPHLGRTSLPFFPLAPPLFSPTTTEMTSYITTSDLEALNIPSSSPSSISPHSVLNSTLSHHSHSTSDYKKVSFCSLAVLIELADEGEVEQAMAQAFKRDLGKKQIAVRTYS